MKAWLKFTGPFFGGIIFAIGLGVGGMTEAENILGFLDIFGQWKPALIFVMVGAILVYAVTYRLILRRKTPLFEKEFLIPKNKNIDRRLLLGAGLFGIGWGMTGLCPGPGLVSLSSGSEIAFVYVAAMIAGVLFGQSKWANRV